MCFETFQHLFENKLHKFDFNLISSFGEYKELLKNLSLGVNDIVVTPQKIEMQGIEYKKIGLENIVLVASNFIDSSKIDRLILLEKYDDLLIELKTHKWYGASTDNEHFKRFWQANFKQLPDFQANYIVPNFKSIINCLSNGPGLAIVPDFLCKQEIEKGELNCIWNGKKKIQNTLYFAFRKQSIYINEIESLMNEFEI
jgi:DNA-binding transcriptional LysR family regulator